MPGNDGKDERSGLGGNVSPPRSCTCPRCGYRMERPPAVPCYALCCPRCESVMTDDG
jgi:hypothetical protein